MNPWRGHPLADVLSRPAIWWEGASAEEVWAFGLSTCTHDDHSCQDNHPDGSTIPEFTEQELHAHLSLASKMLAARKTRWLERYASQLVAEHRRRIGVSNAPSEPQRQG